MTSPRPVTWAATWSLVVSGLLACNFPEFMQTNRSASSGEWRGDVRQQNTAWGTTMTVVEGTLVETRAEGEEGEGTYTRVCLAHFAEHTYVVAHESAAGQRGTLFTCVAFAERGPGVAQLGEAPLVGAMGDVDCANVTTAARVWVDEGRMRRDVCRPTLRGGFSTWVYDSSQRTVICDGYKGETRVEADCGARHGVRFDFRVSTCVPPDMYMRAQQDASCAAVWDAGRWEFVLLRHPTHHYLWLLRYDRRYVAGEMLTAILFNSLTAYNASVVPARVAYLQLDMVRDPPRPVTALCVDDYELCQRWAQPCAAGPAVALSCRRTCGLCNATRPLRCTLREAWRGRWLGADGGAVTVNETYLTVHGGDTDERFYCLNWGDGGDSGQGRAVTQLLVAEFEGGCRPQYACARFLQNSPAVLFFKLTASRRWPFVRRPDEALTCEQFTFGDPEPPRLYRASRLRLLYAPQPRTVPCALPSDVSDKRLTVATRNGTRCNASLATSPQGGEMRLVSDGCRGQLADRLLLCLESSRLLPSRDRVIVTQTFGRSTEILCWVFPKRSKNVVHVLRAAQCDEAASRLLRRGELRPLATLAWGPEGWEPTTGSGEGRLPPLAVAPADTAGPTVVYNVSDNREHENATATSIVVDYYRRPVLILVVIVMFIALQIPCLTKLC